MYPRRDRLVLEYSQKIKILILWNTSKGLKSMTKIFFYYEQQIKRKLKDVLICGCRYNERLKVKTNGSMRLTYTGLSGELEHLKIETTLIG